jgi:hypothetical protein
MDALEIQSSYNLEIRIVASNCHGRWYELSKNVDADRTSLGDLVDEIVDKNPHGYGEIVKVFYFDLDRKVNIEVGTDQDLLALFAKHYVSKCYLMTFAYYRPASGPPYILDWDFGSSEKSVEPPFTPSITGPSFAEPSHSTHTQNGDDEILANPNPMNEHVGVDDECLYIDLGPKHPPNPPNPTTGNKEREEDSSDDEFCSDSDESSGDEPDDEMVTDRGPDPMPDVHYDKKNPPMFVGTLYSDMASFKIALATHCDKTH